MVVLKTLAVVTQATSPFSFSTTPQVSLSSSLLPSLGSHLLADNGREDMNLAPALLTLLG